MRPKTLIRIFFQHFEWSRALDSAGVIHCVHVAAKSEKCTARSTDSWFLCIRELAAGLRSYFQESVVETTSRLAPMHSHTPGSICSFNWSILVGFPIMLRLPAIFAHLFLFSKMYQSPNIHFLWTRGRRCCCFPCAADRSPMLPGRVHLGGGIFVDCVCVLLLSSPMTAVWGITA